MFCGLIEKHSKNRKNYLEEKRKSVHKLNIDKNTLPLNSNVYLKYSNNRTKSYVMLFTCVYKRNLKDDFSYEIGFLLAKLNSSNYVMPITLWDKYGRLIADSNLVRDFSIHTMIPPFIKSRCSLAISYFSALSFQLSLNEGNGYTEDESKLLDMREVPLKRQDSDLVLGVGVNEIDKSLIFAFKTKDSDNSEIGLTFCDSLDECIILEELQDLKLERLIDLYRLKKHNGVALSDNELIAHEAVCERLSELKNNLKDCNLFHILLLLEGVVKVKVRYTLTEDSDKKNYCNIKRVGLDSNKTNSDFDLVNYAILKLKDLSLGYNTQSVKINTSNMSKEDVRDLIRGLILEGACEAVR